MNDRATGLAIDALRQDLAAAFRLTARFGWHESVGNHFSVAVSDDGRKFLMNPKWRHFASIRASDLPVLTIEAGAPATVARLAQEIDTAGRDDGAGCVILGCAGMSALKPALDRQATVPLIDGVAASACLARAAVDCLVAAG